MSDAAEDRSDKRASRLFGRRLVNKRFQLRFSLIIFGMFLAIIMTNWLVGNMTIKHMVEMGLVSNDQFLVQLNTLNNIIVKASAFGMIFVYGVCIFFSHSIAGPIYRFEKVLNELADGNLDVRLKLRKMDEFHEVAEAFNRAMTNLKKRPPPKERS
jgi:signal peptidase II